MSVDIQELRKLQLQEDQVRAKKESFRKDAIDTINCLIAMFGLSPLTSISKAPVPRRFSRVRAAARQRPLLPTSPSASLSRSM